MHTPPLCALYVLDEDKQVRPAKSSDEWRLNLKNTPIIVTQAFEQVHVRTFFTGVNKDPFPGGPPLVFQTIILGRRHPACYDATYREAVNSHRRTLREIWRCVRYVETYVETHVEAEVERRAPLTGLDGGKAREKKPARARAIARPAPDLGRLRSNE